MGSYSNDNFQSATGLEFGVPATHANSFPVQTIQGLISPTTYLLPHVFFDALPTGDGHHPTYDYRTHRDQFYTGKADLLPSMRFPQAAIERRMESATEIQVNPPELINQRDSEERTVVYPPAPLLIGSTRAKSCRVRDRGRHAPHDGPLGFCMWDGGCQRFIKEGTNGDLLNHLMLYHDEVKLTGGKRLHCRWEGCKGIRHSNDCQVSAANLRRHISSVGHVSRFS